uniref:Ig-like domain-containing protein n=1 Tax=Oreochromis aureus TaxID=47969 RepID=A0AAZ1XIJ6_OREAU
MTLICVLIWTLLCCCFTGKSKPQVAVTQPGAVTSTVGGSVNIKCRTGQDVIFWNNKNYLFWYQHKDGGTPKPLVYNINNRASGIPDRFTGSGSNKDFTLSISRITAEDAAVYYCMGRLNEFVSLWYTFGGGTRLDVNCNGSSPPPPDRAGALSEELQQGKATVMCVANKGFPSDWRLSWKVDGRSSSGEESRSPGALQNDGHYSWSSTLRLPADQWEKVGSVTCEATQGSHTPLSQTLMTGQCSQS